MAYRVTSRLFRQRIAAASQRHQYRIGQLQSQISSGLRVQKPSDDPTVFRALLARKALDHRFDAWADNIQASRTQLNSSVSELLSLRQLFQQAKDIAMESRQTTEQNILADQTKILGQNLLDAANRNVNGVYLFAGTAIQSQPFVKSGESVQYQGAADRAHIVVGRQLTVDVLYSGQEVFQSTHRGETLIIGTTGSAAGTGTDSATGRGELLVSHVSTSFAVGSGVQPGASSGTDDNIIGASGTHVLHIEDTSGDGSAGKVSLNGGAEIDFTSADTDLLVSASGANVHVDMSQISAGFMGDVAITATGRLSTDSGLTEIEIDFSDNQQVISSETGAVTNVDTRGTHFAGVDTIEYTGTSDAFQVLKDLEYDLRHKEEGSAWQDSITRHLGDIDRIVDLLLETVGAQSATLDNLNDIEIRNEDIQLETRRVISELEAVDVAGAILGLQSEQSLLELTFASSNALLNMSLLDFIG